MLTVLGPDTLPLKARKPPWFKVPAPGSPRYRELKSLIEREPPHRLPGGGLPEHRRVLAARHRHLHDPGRHVHAPLRLLQRQDGQADLERPVGAGAGGETVARMGLRHAVITSVDRDDLPDLGAARSSA